VRQGSARVYAFVEPCGRYCYELDFDDQGLMVRCKEAQLSDIGQGLSWRRQFLDFSLSSMLRRRSLILWDEITDCEQVK
jgi:hypothetical protein